MNYLKTNSRKQSICNSYDKIKNSEINLTKVVIDLYTENYKILRKETETDNNNWKDISFL